jgi:BirA family biotin operon repressor/biotin-[acetyl-CoA-carboxylase] ligase
VEPSDPSPTTLSLAAGLALIDAVEQVAASASIQLKWPNDLLLGGAKLAGVLLERSGDRIVAGFGVNLAAAPKVPGRTTASLGGAIEPRAFAPLLAAGFDRRLGQWRNQPADQLVSDWMARAHPLGTALTVHSGGGEIVAGHFGGLEPDGALRLETADGQLIVRAGDVDLG